MLLAEPLLLQAEKPGDGAGQFRQVVRLPADCIGGVRPVGKRDVCRAQDHFHRRLPCADQSSKLDAVEVPGIFTSASRSSNERPAFSFARASSASAVSMIVKPREPSWSAIIKRISNSSSTRRI